jgi:hypothetical protein
MVKLVRMAGGIPFCKTNVPQVNFSPAVLALTLTADITRF